MTDGVMYLCAIGGVALLFLILWGIMELAFCITNKVAKNKWYKALATDEYLRELVYAEKHLWSVYDKKSEIANGYKKQIDTLLCGLTYLPSYEKDWREAQAEIYKQQYFEARKDTSRWYDAYVLANDNLNDYCRRNKLKRMS